MSDDSETVPRVGPPAASGSSAAPRVGEIVAEKYRVERVLGEGGMGVVVAAKHVDLDESFAIKFLHADAKGDPAAAARFLREARAAVRIKSEHVARVSDFGNTKDGVPFIVMELLDGRDLADVIASGIPVPIEDAVDWLLQACEGIAEAHAMGIVHRDLKPANLFLAKRSDGVAFVKVLDFGISKLGDEAPSASITTTSAVFGSPAYMSPEQIRSAKNVDQRTDIWSLGVILFELLAGKLPFTGETATAILAAISADVPPGVRTLRPEVPEALEAVIAKCLAKPPGERYASIADFANALEPFRSPTSIASVGRIRRLSAPPSSKPVISEGAARKRVAAAYASTDAPVTTVAAPRSRGRWLGVIAAFAGVAIVLRLAGQHYLHVEQTPGPLATPSALRSEAPPPPTPTEPPPATPSAAPSASSTPATAPLASDRRIIVKKRLPPPMPAASSSTPPTTTSAKPLDPLDPTSPTRQ